MATTDEIQAFQRGVYEIAGRLSAQIRSDQNLILSLANSMQARVGILDALVRIAESAPAVLADADLSAAMAGEGATDGVKVH